VQQIVPPFEAETATTQQILVALGTGIMFEVVNMISFKCLGKMKTA
jgi:hypothetical protein